jgi:hypothetical protein
MEINELDASILVRDIDTVLMPLAAWKFRYVSSVHLGECLLVDFEAAVQV